MGNIYLRSIKMITAGKLFLLIMLFTFSSTCFSQVVGWVWVNGDSTINSTGVQGTANVPDISNSPGAVRDAITWTDHSGNLWLFGGYGINATTGTQTPRGNLWKYNPSTNEWTRIQPVPGINPSYRWGCANWIDIAGDLWLFGGFGLSQDMGGTYLNDLWKYNISTNTWILINSFTSSANVYGVYGTQGVPASTNRPGGRFSSQSWIDNAGIFWLFGGVGYGTSGIQGYLGDLWKYDSNTNDWTWVNGGEINYQASFGNMYIPDASNHPGARWYGITWTDSSNHLWLLGGIGFINSPNAYLLNDMWQYDIDSNQWTWMNGENTGGSYTAYGTMGVPSFDNRPGAIMQAVTWTDMSGNLWLYGGTGNTQVEEGRLNSLWRYNPSTFEWTWLNGNIAINKSPAYGTKGVAAASNQPGSRAESMGWTDNLGNIWLFGGDINNTNTGYDDLRNDLWKMTLTTVPVKLISFTGKLKDDDVSLYWTVENEVNFDRYEIERSTNGINFNKVSQVKAMGVKNYNADDNISELHEGIVYYRLKMVDIDGKYTYSKVINFHTPANITFNLSPNPANDFTRLIFTKALYGEINTRIADLTGKIIFNDNYKMTGTSINIPTNKLPMGTYAVTVVYKGETFLRKLVIVH